MRDRFAHNPSLSVLALVLLLAFPLYSRAQPASAGSALRFFSGQNSYVQVSGYGNAAPTNEITIEFWVRVSLVQQQSTLSLYPDSDTNRINIHLPFADGIVYWDFGDIGNGGRLSYKPSQPITLTWQHYAFVASQSGSYMGIYRNGVLDAFKPSMTPFVRYNADLILGAFLDDNFFFAGDLDEVRIWNVARTQAQIQNTMHQTLVGNEAGLVAYWRFDEGSGTNATDSTTNGLVGSFSGNPVWLHSTAPFGGLNARPIITMHGPNPLTNSCHGFYYDPGATIPGVAVAISGGERHELVLRNDGTLEAWGNPTYPILTNIPPGATNIVSFSAGTVHSLAARADGKVFAWGINPASGAVTNVPPSATNVVAVATGGDFSLALRADGTLVTWGNTNYGLPNIPSSAVNVIAIAAGGDHSLALRSDGTVVAWGTDGSGESDIPSYLNVSNIVAIAAGAGFSMALRPDGTVVSWGSGCSSFSGSNIVAISAFSDHGIALRADGTFSESTGFNCFYFDGASPFVTNLVAVAAGNYNLALSADGNVVVFPPYASPDYSILIPPSDLSPHPVSPTGSVDPDVPGAYYLTYNYSTLPPVTRTVVFADTNPPAMTLLGTNPISLVVGSSFTDPGATATNTCAGDLTGNIIVLGAVNTNRVGTYNLIYAVIDPSGNFSTTNRVVWVTPAVPPPTARLNLSDAASLNASDTLAWFEYGLTTSYGSSTTPQDLGTGTGLVPLSVTLSNLLPGTTYHYRLVTTNALTGLVDGPDMTFTTSPYLVPGDLDGDGVVGQSELNAVLSNYWIGSPWLSMTNASGLSTTDILFSLTNADNFDLSVLASTNLLDWQYIGVAHQRYEFFDPAATNLPVRYYRLRWP
jgi:hypothetical protein